MMKGKIRLSYSDIIKNQATINCGSFGHVSAGKSTTIRSITGIRTQRHKKEIEKNLTINLGYANVKIFQDMKTGHLAVAKSNINEMSNPITGDPMTLVRHLSFVDSPGHSALLSVMLSCVEIVDSALLVIAGNDPIVPQAQTYEHMLALNRAGINNVLILQNKLDLVSKSEAVSNLNKIREFINGSPVESSVILPVSAQFGSNIDQVIKYLRHGIGEPMRRLNEPARITIVRSFDVNKPNTKYTDIIGGVIGGSVVQGTIFVGDWLEIRPGVMMPDGKCHPLLARIVSLYSEKNKMEYAIPGGLIAIGLDIDPGLTRNNKLVGSVAGKPGTLPPIYNTMQVKYGRLRKDVKLAKLKVGDKLVLSANSATINATVERAEKKRVILKTERLICGDVGMSVALLRNNPKTSSVNLDYCGKIETVTEFTNFYYPEFYKEIVDHAVEREVEIVLDIPRTEQVVFKYAECLDNIKFKDKEEKVRFVMPEVTYDKPYSTFANFDKCAKSMDFHNRVTGEKSHEKFIDIQTHLVTFIQTELVTSCTLNGQMQMIIRGHYNQKNMLNLISRYIDQFLKCKNCNRVGCSLYKKDKLNFQYCDVCCSQHSLSV